MRSVVPLLAFAVCIGAADILNGKHLTIITVEDPPMSVVRKNKDSQLLPSDQWNGWMIEQIKLMAKEANFTYTLRLYDETYNETTPVEKLKKLTSYGLADQAITNAGADHVRK
jgi:hypothetical protein